MLHALFFSLELELLEGRVRAYSRGPTELAQQTYTGGLSLCSPFLSGQGHPRVLGFLCGFRFPFLLPPPSSPSSSGLLFLLLILFSPSSFPPLWSSPAAFLPPVEPCAASTGPGSCSSPGGLQRAALHPLGTSAARASCEVRWEEADWEPRRVDAAERGAAPAGGCLGLGSGAGARILPLLLGPGFGAGLGGAGSAP